MTFRGRVRGNTVVMDESTGLPDGTEVSVEIAVVTTSAPDGASFAERFQDFAGCLEGLPEDFAENHDHYIHGTPKRNA